MAKSIDICCPQCGRLYHADESHLGKSIRCVQCGNILLLIVGERPASEQRRSADPEVQFWPQSRGSDTDSCQSSASTVRAQAASSFGRIGRGLNRPQKFVFALAMFAFVITAVRPPFLVGRGVRYHWLWSRSGSRIELTRLLVEWVLIAVIGAVVVFLLKESAEGTPFRSVRLWLLHRWTIVRGYFLSFQRPHRVLLALLGALLLVAIGVVALIVRNVPEHPEVQDSSRKYRIEPPLQPSDGTRRQGANTAEADRRSAPPPELSPSDGAVDFQPEPNADKTRRKKSKRDIFDQVQPRDGKAKRPDLGVDVAIPLAAVWMHKEPSSESPGTVLASRGALLVLVHRETRNGWYSVFDIPTGKEGWVRQDDVEIRLTTKPRAAPSIAEIDRGTDTAPAITVKNDTDDELTLHIAERTYLLARRAEQSIPVPEGKFWFSGSVPGAIPAFGTKEFKRGYEYRWRFWIVRTPL